MPNRSRAFLTILISAFVITLVVAGLLLGSQTLWVKDNKLIMQEPRMPANPPHGQNPSAQ